MLYHHIWLILVTQSNTVLCWCFQHHCYATDATLTEIDSFRRRERERKVSHDAYSSHHSQLYATSAVHRKQSTNNDETTKRWWWWQRQQRYVYDQEDEHICALSNFVSTGNHAEEFIHRQFMWHNTKRSATKKRIKKQHICIVIWKWARLLSCHIDDDDDDDYHSWKFMVVCLCTLNLRAYFLTHIYVRTFYRQTHLNFQNRHRFSANVVGI